jgi:hypothetical protein
MEKRRAAGAAGDAANDRREVITKAIAKQLTWIQASEIPGISAPARPAPSSCCAGSSATSIRIFFSAAFYE